ncbi:MAG: tungstate ABC transporter substrate-binding protein WtpA [Methanocellales archaeon]|nr:tungstate ABC transporter substrate-binding protein WtpA [Methanocellales archaeon]MDD3291681.1 tungstate ABC transporter substrate-binding protein WtpA [Methanocellales archaeon]MDD5235031.1 tungstate ABC transporter substrate-binding protein WtpA [Methanocellales archaeon]MDD5485169.1 tungstate ABC transporter substrate-binding protein WtpA [Methanocellales archaeon]
MEKRKLRILGVVIALLLGTLVVPCIPARAQGTQIIRVFHAGSLAVPLEEAAIQFEALHPGVDVQRQSHGSVEAIRQITEVGKIAEVLASADYSLIPSMMYPDFADWDVRFATNDLVLAYNPEKSSYAKEITPENWYEILRRDGVVFGFSNPNLDPCGYRTVMVFQLAELHYGDGQIFDDLILNKTAITISEEADGTYLIKTPEDMKPDTSKVDIRPKSVELVAFVEEGGLDYAFEYRSVAVQHGLSFVDLPVQIDLSSVDHADGYKKVKLQTSDGNINIGSPVVYGITVPKNADNADLGLEFVKFIISKPGQKIFSDMGQPAIVPAVGNGSIPEDLKPYVTGAAAAIPEETATSLMVYCGAGMRKPMDEIGSIFYEKHGVKIEYNYAGSNALLSQMELTKAGDCYMPGETMYIEIAAEKGFIDYQQMVCYHIPVITVPKGNPANIMCLEDLARKGVKLVWGDPQVAATGKTGVDILKKNNLYEKVWPNVIATVPTMNEVMVMIAMGQADASINWWDTVKFVKEIDVIEIPREQNEIQIVPMGTTTFTKYPNTAKKFVDFVASEEGKAIFEKHGFTAYPNPEYEEAISVSTPTPTLIAAPTPTPSYPGHPQETPEPTPTPTTKPTPAPTPAPAPTPKPTPVPTVRPILTPAPALTEPSVPGFEAAFAIVGLLAVAYLISGRKNNP